MASLTGGTNLPDGVYSVTLSYQDALGNPAASAASANVSIDTTAPTLGAASIASNHSDPA